MTPVTRSMSQRIADLTDSPVVLTPFNQSPAQHPVQLPTSHPPTQDPPSHTMSTNSTPPPDPSANPATQVDPPSVPPSQPPVDVTTLLALLNANNANQQHQQNTTLLAAIEALTQSRSEPKLELTNPEKFNGTSDKKLQPFFFTCELNFDTNPRHFATDERKIQYAIAHFADTPLVWVRTQSALQPRPDFFSTWKLFKEKITKMYGIQDPSSAAASGLDNLYMRENHKCNRYVADFLALSTQLNWGDDVLEHIFFRHLPQRLRTEIIRAGRRSGFEALKEQALALDRNYWEVVEESKTTTTQAQQTNNKSNNNNNNTNNKNKNKSDSPSKSSTNSGSGNGNSSSSDASKNSGKNGKKDLTNVLVNGRLKPDVRQHRIDNDLCLYCGKKGHKAPECNLRAHNQANKDNNNNNNNTQKARAATTVPDKKAEASAPTSSTTLVSGN